MMMMGLAFRSQRVGTQDVMGGIMESIEHVCVQLELYNP